MRSHPRHQPRLRPPRPRRRDREPDRARRCAVLPGGCCPDCPFCPSGCIASRGDRSSRDATSDDGRRRWRSDAPSIRCSSCCGRSASTTRRGFVGDRALAEDCAQDALVKLFGSSIDSIASATALTWALTFATWQCRTDRAASATAPRAKTTTSVDAEHRRSRVARSASSCAPRSTTLASLARARPRGDRRDAHRRRRAAPRARTRHLSQATRACARSAAHFLEVSPWHALTSRSRACARRTSARTCSSAVRGIALAVGLVARSRSRCIARRRDVARRSSLAATLATLGWRGGAWRRGALAGVFAGLPRVHRAAIYSSSRKAALPAIADGAVADVHARVLRHELGRRRRSSVMSRRAMHRRVALRSARSPAALLTGLLGCGTTGLGGALGIVVGLVAGGVTGWVVASRTAHA